MNAILYTTNTGSAERYAKLLAEKVGLSAYSLDDATEQVPKGAEILYIGWIAAGKIQGYSAAAKRFKIRAVCGVGMCRTDTQKDTVRKKTAVPENTPLFTLQGNFDVNKLHGIYRLMMELMVKKAGKSLSEKKNRTPDEEDMLDMMLHGGERVKVENLKNVLNWYYAQGQNT